MSGGAWRGLELCLAPRHVATTEALDAAIAVGREVAGSGHVLTAECPVAWPSGAFVRVDRLDDEARHGIEASARFAAEIGAKVLTIHLFVPMTPEEYRRAVVAWMALIASWWTDNPPDQHEDED